MLDAGNRPMPGLMKLKISVVKTLMGYPMPNRQSLAGNASTKLRGDR